MKRIYESELEKRFDQEIDEMFDPITIFGIEYDYSLAAKRVDSVSYRQEYLGWLDNLIKYDEIIERDGDYYEAQV